jgi:hypothetical protein
MPIAGEKRKVRIYLTAEEAGELCADYIAARHRLTKSSMRIIFNENECEDQLQDIVVKLWEIDFWRTLYLEGDTAIWTIIDSAKK